MARQSTLLERGLEFFRINVVVVRKAQQDGEVVVTVYFGMGLASFYFVHSMHSAAGEAGTDQWRMSKYLLYALLNGLGPGIKPIHESVDASSKVETE